MAQPVASIDYFVRLGAAVDALTRAMDCRPGIELRYCNGVFTVGDKSIGTAYMEPSLDNWQAVLYALVREPVAS